MIDWARVSELAEEFPPEDFGEIIGLFVEEVEDVLARIKGAPQHSLQQEDFHFLKGGAVNLGFSDFAALCSSAEKSLSDGNFDAVDVPAILDCYAVSLAAFSERAAELGLAA